MNQYLLCKQCGMHRFFVKNKDGENVYFHIDFNRKPFPTEQSNADLTGLDFSEIHCCSCSWIGNLTSSGLGK